MPEKTEKNPQPPAPAQTASAAPVQQPKAPPQPRPAAQHPPVKPPVRRTFIRPRHLLLALSFVLFVILPALGTAWYLWVRAADQYASSVGFSVRREDAASPVELLSGGIPGLSGSSSSDTDILYEFIQSQELVADIDATINLKALWSKPENDPYFSFAQGGTIEDLMLYWDRMIKIYYDRTAGLIGVRILAFEADDATLIAQTLLDKSSEMINNLSAIAREDAIRYSWEELTEAKERLTEARQIVQQFRNRHQLVDPSVDVMVQSQLIGSLQGQLTEARISLDLLSSTAAPSDPRVTQANRRISVIEAQIEEERHKLGVGDGHNQGEAFADIIGEYERLVVEREFAEKTYVTSLASYDASLAEARRKSRYLAAYAQPTRAESARFPQRGVILGFVSLFLFLAWSIATLVAYSLKDRR